MFGGVLLSGDLLGAIGSLLLRCFRGAFAIGGAPAAVVAAGAAGGFAPDGGAGGAGAFAGAAGGVAERRTGGPPTNRGLGTAGRGGSVEAGAGGRAFGGASDSNSSSTSNAEPLGVSPYRSDCPSTSVAVGKSDFCSVASLNAGGGLTITMPPHLGHERIWPIAAGSRTFSRDLHVVQVIANSSMPLCTSARVPQLANRPFRIVCQPHSSQAGLWLGLPSWGGSLAGPFFFDNPYPHPLHSHSIAQNAIVYPGSAHSWVQSLRRNCRMCESF